MSKNYSEVENLGIGKKLDPYVTYLIYMISWMFIIGFMLLPIIILWEISIKSIILEIVWLMLCILAYWLESRNEKWKYVVNKD